MRRSSPSSSRDCNDVVELNISNNFDWNENCCICGEEATIEKEKKKRQELRKTIKSVESSNFTTNLLHKLSFLKDDFHREIYKRLCDSRDLVTLRAKYHHECLRNVIHQYEETIKVPRNNYSSKVDQAMEEIFEFMLSSQECQFTITELQQAIKFSDITPSENTIKQRLKNRFSDQIVFSSRMGGVTYVCFTNNLYDILTDAWYKNRKQNIEEEEERLIDSASELIRRKIRSTICRMDEYPASDKIFDKIEENIPPLLIRFLQNVIYKDKKKNDSNNIWYSRKIFSIAHAIMSAARPKSFLSPLQLAIGSTFYRKFGSKKIIKICYQLGFSCSYSEVKLYEICAADQMERRLINPFIQIVSDNSDFNVCTLDGKGTFHNLGTIEIITPGDCLQERTPIKRLLSSKIPKESELVEKNKIDLLLYTEKAGKGLSLIKFENIENVPSFQVTITVKLNNLWMFFKYINDNNFLGWNGFMSMICSCRENYEVSKINFLPFINASPSDYNTLYTALVTASQIVLKEGMKTCIITFDQPLYIKACDIVEAKVFDQTLMIVRLGGFHLLMSFMGCIGEIMGGSGIKDIFALIYAEGSVDKILNGHSYARAVRAHILLQQALSLLIFDELKNESVEFKNLTENEDYFTYDMNIDEINSNEAFKSLNELIENHLQKIEKRGKTAKLWIQYFRMVTLLKQFLAAERMGDWKAHLECVELTIPFFHAAGHFNYAKSTRLYLQRMRSLKEKMDPEEFKKFTDGGYFTSRRTNIFWSGIFSDQTIEQTLMRALSVEGGPFKRGCSESVVFKFIKGIIYTKDIIEGLERFCDLEFNKSHQHVDSRDARITRDMEDVQKLQQFLREHNPFDDNDNLRNIVTGLIGTEEINCHEALSIGIQAMKAINGKYFNEIKLSKKDKVISLHGVNSKLKIGDTTVAVDPLLLFQRICVIKKSDVELELCLKFELAPYPLSLFDDVGLRKTTKASLYSLFQPADANLDKNDSHYFIDGGMLLYRVKWPSDCTFQRVFQEYISYLKRNFGQNITVIFDSYNEQSTKVTERNRRSQKFCCKVYQFTPLMPVSVSQDKFFSNYQNKSKFIQLLMVELEKQSIHCHQSKGEADGLVVELAIQDTSVLQKIIVAEDVDILVILTARAKVEKLEKEIYFLKLGKQNSSSTLYSSTSFEIDYPDSAKLIAFSHAFTGCDTVSAFYNKGKKRFFDIVEKRLDVREYAEILYSSTAKPKEILDAGRYCAIMLYGAAKDTQLTKLKKITDLENFLEKMRYEQFIKTTTKNSAVKLSSLLPTVDAIDEHTKRCYFQIQQWLGNENIRATDWGWYVKGDSLLPVCMKKPPAPDELLKMIFCQCKKGCGALCGCRKVGLYCNSTCSGCSREDCSNSPPVIEEDEDDIDHDEDEINDIDI